MTLGKIWGQIKLAHPDIHTRSVDWDSPLLAAIPKVRSSITDDEFAHIVDDMLAALHDPVSRVEFAAAKPLSPSISARRPLHRIVRGALILDLPSLEDLSHDDATDALKAVPSLLASAKAVVIDMRFTRAESAWIGFSLEAWAAQLLPANSRTPSARAIVHAGYAPQTSFPSVAGFHAFVTIRPGHRYQLAPELKPAGDNVRVVLLVNSNAMLDAAAWALQGSGRGLVVTQGTAIVTRGDWDTVALPGGHTARLRINDWYEAPFPADVALRANQDGFDRAVALALNASPRKPRAAHQAELDPPRPIADSSYREQVAPTREYRLLALYRVWNAISRFYPYPARIGDWNAVLPEFIPRFEAATTAEAYAAALLELGARVPDGHTYIWGHPAISTVFGGSAGLPVALRWIEGKAVITVIDDEFGHQSGLAVGDVVLSVDGEPMLSRIQRLLPYVSASTEATRYRNVLAWVLAGPVGDTSLVVQGARGEPKRITTPRLKTWTLPYPKVTPPYRLLGTDLGYVSLSDLTVDQVEAMFEALKDTKGIVFDMRGYPKVTMFKLASRLNTRHMKTGALFYRPQVSSAITLMEEIRQPIQPTPLPLYEGKTVMLIDERTQSQAEHTGLLLEAANGTKFVGTPSAGADGEVTTIALPGGISWMFTGLAALHADGRQLQGLGLQPDVRVEPTIQGIRARKDEVLERAIALLRTGK